MGFYSSWAVFTLTHHYIYYVCSRINNIHYRHAKYRVLGDDSLCGDSYINKSYLEIIKHLNCPISAAKTHVSNDIFEFAKRWFIRKVEISPFPIPALAEANGNYSKLLPLVEQEITRSWFLTSHLSIPDLTIHFVKHYRQEFNNAI
jgi:hypothetical protein